MPANKRVRVTLELTSEFLRLLNANVRLKLLDSKTQEVKTVQGQLGPIDLVGLLVWSEACGQKEAEQWALVPPASRPDAPEVINSERRVYESQEQIAGPNLGESSDA